MGKRRGGYLGGSTIIVGQGFQPVRCFKQPGGEVGGGVGPERERQKRLKREQEKKAHADARARIKANEKLIRRVAKQWREQKGQEHFRKLTAERRQIDAEPSSTESTTGRTLAQALQSALEKRQPDTE